MSQEANVRRSDERNLIRRAKLDDLDATARIGIAEDLSLHEEVTDGAVIMETAEWDEMAIGVARQVGEGYRSVIEPGERVQGRTERSHRPVEGDQRGHQDLSSESSHPGQ